MNSHRKTDPACAKHIEPNNVLAWWWFNLNRGKACIPCMETRRAALKGAGNE